MRLLPALSALVACHVGFGWAELHHEKIQRSLEARTWAHETRDLTDIFGSMKTCDGCQVWIPTHRALFFWLMARTTNTSVEHSFRSQRPGKGWRRDPY